MMVSWILFNLMFPPELSIYPLLLVKLLQIAICRVTANFLHALWEELTHNKQSSLGTTWLLPILHPFFPFALPYSRSRVKANRVLPREHTSHTKHPFPTTQEKTLHMDITRWSTLKSDWLYSWQPKMEKLYRVSKNKTWSWLWLWSWAPYCKIQA